MALRRSQRLAERSSQRHALPLLRLGRETESANFKWPGSGARSERGRRQVLLVGQSEARSPLDQLVIRAHAGVQHELLDGLQHDHFAAGDNRLAQ